MTYQPLDSGPVAHAGDRRRLWLLILLIVLLAGGAVAALLADRGKSGGTVAIPGPTTTATATSTTTATTTATATAVSTSTDYSIATATTHATSTATSVLVKHGPTVVQTQPVTDVITTTAVPALDVQAAKIELNAVDPTDPTSGSSAVEPITVGDLLPGDPGKPYAFAITNNGNVPLNMTVQISSLTGDTTLANTLTLSGNVTGQGGADASSPAGMHLANNETILGDPVTGKRVLAPGAQDVVTVQIGMPASVGNALAGKSLSFSLVITGSQV